MTRICPNCGYKVENDLLPACPECKKLLGDELGRLSHDEEQRVIKGLKRSVLHYMFFLGGALVVITALSLWGIKERLEKTTLERVAEKFEEPRIQILLEDVAKTKTMYMMQRQIDPELRRFQKKLNEKGIEFEEFQNVMKEKMQRDYQLLSDELLSFQKRTNLLKLADMAIGNMSRSAYEELVDILNNPSDVSLQLAAKAEIVRVNNALANSARTAGVKLSVEGSAGLTRNELDLTTSELIDILIDDPDWTFRARSAQLLAEKKEIGVPVALLESMKDEENLEVFKYAVRAFKAVTGCKAPDIFEYEYCSEWWDTNSEAVNEKMRASE
jgi:hypothetical protein